MAIYSLHISAISRGKGKNACNTLSYMLNKNVHCDRTGTTYKCRRGAKDAQLMYFETLLPENVSTRYKDPTILFNEVESYEKLSTARVAVKVSVALPCEFSFELQKQVMQEFCQKIVDMNYALMFAIYNDENNHNPYSHILIVHRPFDKEGNFSMNSKRVYALDENGNRIPLIDEKTGLQKLRGRNCKQWKRVNLYRNPLDSKEMFNNLRVWWAEICNKYLDKENQISCKSYEEQGFDKVATIHEGYAATHIEKRGGKSERCKINREIKQVNLEIEKINQEIKEIELEKEKLEQCLKSKS